MMTRRPTRLIVLAVSLLTAAACGGDDSTGVPDGGATVSGVVVAADGETPIPGAVVTLLEVDDAPVDTTDLQGRYELAGVPSGEQTLLARRGVFEARITVTVDGDEAVTAPIAELLSTGDLAFVPGSYDAIEHIVRDQLGNEMTELSAEDFANASELAKYKMIFINCGADTWTIMGDAASLQNLRDYVRNGGIVYSSDLTLDLVKEAFPEAVTGEQLSSDAQTIMADVVSPALRQTVGKSKVELAYDLGSWASPSALASSVEVLVRGDIVNYDETLDDQPLAFVISAGQGKLVFTSFHNEAGITEDQHAVLRHFIYLD